tara:strand:+ start:34338 stop:36695 length:2358 start_codon:yes stop_codon:yes gene_type:complete
MNMKYFLLAFSFALTAITFSQNHHLNLLSTLDYDAMHNTELNDVWGYVDENGNEYALVGAAKGVSVVDISDPQNPVEVYWHQGSESVWRDLKVFGDYAYITTEADDGLLILDLTPLPGNSITSTTNYFGNGNNWSSAHNIYIDENGYGYIFGANRGEGGVIILDLFTDPMNPQEVGSFDNWYVHDGYVRNDTMYLAHIYDGFFSIVDITDINNPVVLGTKETPSSFAHNIWPSDDGNYVFTTDEVSDAYLAAYDVSDPSNIFEVDRIQSSPGFGVVPHNAHVNGDFLITSYYADGTTVHDISDPSNMVEVGRYDTYPGTADFTTGNWGTYPFLPSGNIISTDIEYGFFVLGPDYDHAAKLEGQVTDNSTSNPIQGAQVSISGEPHVETTNLAGNYKTGVAEGGTYDVIYERYGYEPQTIQTQLTNGDTVIQDVALVPLPEFSLTVNVVDINGDPIIDADVRIQHTQNTFEFQTNGLGQVETILYYEDDYTITAGKWEYRTDCISEFIDPSTQEVTLTLDAGIYDDFSFDFGWSETSDAEVGDWERAIPAGENVNGNFPNPSADSHLDCDNYAFITDNSPGTEGNVTEGQVTLISPIFDITGMNDPYINYQRWFFNFYGAQPFNDTLRVVLSNGTDFVEIDKIGSEPSTFDQWIPVSVRVNDYITPTATMQLFFSTSDYDSHVNIVDAAIDLFEVSEGSIADIEEETTFSDMLVRPNPFTNKFTITNSALTEESNIQLLDAQGKRISIDVSIAGDEAIAIVTISDEAASGLYFLNVGTEVVKLIKE